MISKKCCLFLATSLAALAFPPGTDVAGAQACRVDASAPDRGLHLGREVAVAERLRDGEEFELSISELLRRGQELFEAPWTVQEGGGRPRTTGTGQPLADADDPLLFPRNFNRVSAPDANSCAGCHNLPSAGGGGDHVTNVFVLGQRFDFATFDAVDDHILLKGSVDANGVPVTLQTIANSRATLGMFGSGFIEMLARQMTKRLQALRDGLDCGATVRLRANGVDFGVLSRTASGCDFDVSKVTGLPAPSLAGAVPTLIVRPFHQVGAVVSLREFTNNAFNHHHGIQTAERFGYDQDPDGDGFCNEMTSAEVTATSVWQATLPVPGHVIPSDRELENAIMLGSQTFRAIGCPSCHKPALELRDRNWIYTEPSPFNPPGNLQVGETETLTVDLTSPELPGVRLRPARGVVRVPAFTDLKLHDITKGPDDPNCEMLDQTGTDADTDGNCMFLTRKLWGAANEPPYFHHGQYTTLRQAIEAHFGEAKAQRRRFLALGECEQGSLIEFLKTMQVLPEGVTSRIVDENFEPKPWPPADRARRLLEARQRCSGATDLARR